METGVPIYRQVMVTIVVAENDTNRRFTLIIIIAKQGGTHSHPATGTASRRRQRKLGHLAPCLSAGRTPTPPSHPPRRTRAPSLLKIYQYIWY
jgi:hypothetical protein